MKRHARGQEGDDFLRSEVACIGEPREDAVDGVEWLGDSQVGRRHEGIGAADEDVEAGRARAVAETDRTSQVDAVARVREPLYANGALVRTSQRYLCSRAGRRGAAR